MLPTPEEARRAAVNVMKLPRLSERIAKAIYLPSEFPLNKFFCRQL
jgi:hypothetical protein